MKQSKAKAATIDSRLLHLALWHSFLVIGIYLLLIVPAHAGTLCTVANIAVQNYGRGLATLGVLGVGIGATLGKVSWTLAVTVAVGISILFSAGVIAGTLGGGC